jgi:hypothetical protein
MVQEQTLDRLRVESLVQQAEISEMKLAYETNNKIEFFSNYYPKQQEILDAFLDPRYIIIIFCGANQIGKTMLLTILGVSTMIGYYPWSGQRIRWFSHNGPRKVRFVGPNWDAHKEEGQIYETMEEWWPRSREVKTKGSQNCGKAIWRDIETNSTMVMASAESKTKAHEGKKFDLVLFDEPCPRPIWIANKRGLIARRGKAVFGMTLLEEDWIDAEIVHKKDDMGRPDKSVYAVEATIYDNEGYGLTKKGIEEFESGLSDEDRQARMLGIPAYKTGLVLKQFNERTHIKVKSKVSLEWIVEISIDFHPRKRQAVSFVGHNRRGERWVIDEIWEFGSGRVIAEEIVRRVKANSYRVEHDVLIDPLAKGDGNNDDGSSFDQIERILIHHGMGLDAGSKDRDGGILALQDYLLSQNGISSLYVMHHCVRTIHEFNSWIWNKDTQKAVDKNDDMMSNLYRILLRDSTWFEPRRYKSRRARPSSWKTV